jgi:hypothetical protein
LGGPTALSGALHHTDAGDDDDDDCGANLFATSRLIPGISEQFEGSTSLQIRASEEDIRRYLDGRMSQLPTFIGRDSYLQERIKTEIVKAVDGMYVHP